jgi:predicted amidohydrolase YtcJ
MTRTSDKAPSPRPGPKSRSLRHSALALFGTLCIIVACAATGLAEDTPAPPVNNQAETIFRGGHIVTVDPKQPEVEALAIAQGKIIAVGDEKTVMQRRGAGTKVIDLHGDETLMPGFVEPHTHVIQTAFDIDTHLMTNLSSFSVPMIPGTIEQIKNELTAALPKSGWLLAWGVDPSRSTPFMASLDAKTLDEVQAGVKTDDQVPIFVLNQSGHVAYVNTRALKLAGIDGHTQNPEGGVYLRKDKKCVPNEATDCPLTGELDESPAYAVFRKQFFTESFKKSVAEKMPGALVETYRRFASAGVTTATELGLGTVTGNIGTELTMLETMARIQETPLRIRAYLDAHFIDSDAIKKYGLGLRPSDDLMSVIGVKFFADGSTQALTAALKIPYGWPGGTLNRGQLNYLDDKGTGKTGEDQLFEEAKPYLEQGWQLAIHANGDRATEQALKVYDRLNTAEAQKTKHDPATLRCRIEHFTVVDEGQIKQVRRLGLTPSMTIGHPYFWGYAFGATKKESDHEPILGSPRAEQMDPANWLLGSKESDRIRFSFNSDAPISPVAPLRYISTAVTRRWQDGPEQKEGVLGKGIPVDAAIRAVTLDAAYQLFLDDYVGSLEVGKLADLVILDKNPRALEKTPEDIMKIKVLSTYLSGVKKYEAPAPAASAR